MTAINFGNVGAFNFGHLKYPAVTESWRTFPGAKLAVGWGLEVVRNDVNVLCQRWISECK